MAADASKKRKISEKIRITIKIKKIKITQIKSRKIKKTKIRTTKIRIIKENQVITNVK